MRRLIGWLFPKPTYAEHLSIGGFVGGKTTNRKAPPRGSTGKEEDLKAPRRIKLYSEAVLIFPSHKMSIYQREEDQFHKQHNYALEEDNAFLSELKRLCTEHGAYIGPQKPHDSTPAIDFSDIEIKRK